MRRRRCAIAPLDCISPEQANLREAGVLFYYSLLLQEPSARRCRFMNATPMKRCGVKPFRIQTASSSRLTLSVFRVIAFAKTSSLYSLLT